MALMAKLIVLAPPCNRATAHFAKTNREQNVLSCTVLATSHCAVLPTLSLCAVPCKPPTHFTLCCGCCPPPLVLRPSTHYHTPHCVANNPPHTHSPRSMADHPNVSLLALHRERKWCASVASLLILHIAISHCAPRPSSRRWRQCSTTGARKHLGWLQSRVSCCNPAPPHRGCLHVARDPTAQRWGNVWRCLWQALLFVTVGNHASQLLHPVTTKSHPFHLVVGTRPSAECDDFRSFRHSVAFLAPCADRLLNTADPDPIDITAVLSARSVALVQW